MTVGAVDFVLTHFNTDISMSVLATLDSGSVPDELSTDATAILEISQTAIQNVFTFQSDSFDVNDVSATDIKYFVNFNSAWPSEPELSLNPALAMMDHPNSSGGYLVDNNNINTNKKLVKHDFLRYLADELFNTPYGVDLFNNESQLLADLRAQGQANWINNMKKKMEDLDSEDGVLAADDSQGLVVDNYTNKKCTTDNYTSNQNIARELFRQILGSNQQARFQQTTFDSETKQAPIPIRAGDSISFRFTVNPAPNQHLLTGLSTPIQARTYRIKLNVVATDNDVDNTEEAAEEIPPV
jgi:hypothetical protein